MADKSPRRQQRRSAWQTAAYVLLAIELFVLITGYWRFILVMTSFGVIDFYLPTAVTISLSGVLMGYGLLAFIVTDLVAVVAVYRQHPRAVFWLRISFFWIVGLALLTLTTAWIWQNAVFFFLWLLLSATKVFIVQRGLHLAARTSTRTIK